MATKKNLKGIRGWLILLGIYIGVKAIRSLNSFLILFIGFIKGSISIENNLLILMSYIELVYNFVIMLAMIYIAYLFFQESKRFPKWFIGIHILIPIFYIIDVSIVQTILQKSLFKVEDLLLTILPCIWIPYLLLSKRVKTTFIN